jgi:hypothetical protein
MTFAWVWILMGLYGTAIECNVSHTLAWYYCNLPLPTGGCYYIYSGLLFRTRGS